MRKIRQGMFETNSSSAHSIVIAMGECTDKLHIDDGIVIVQPGEYGWEVEDYHGATDKASYCLTYAKQGGSEEKLAMLKKVIKKQTGAREVVFAPLNPGAEWSEWGYIDHQSGPSEGGECGEAFQSETNLRQFIFCRASVLHTDNDNN